MAGCTTPHKVKLVEVSKDPQRGYVEFVSRGSKEVLCHIARLNKGAKKGLGVCGGKLQSHLRVALDPGLHHFIVTPWLETDPKTVSVQVEARAITPVTVSIQFDRIQSHPPTSIYAPTETLWRNRYLWQVDIGGSMSLDSPLASPR